MVRGGRSDGRGRVGADSGPDRTIGLATTQRQGRGMKDVARVLKVKTGLGLRRLADKIDPEWVREIHLEWKRDMPPYVDIKLATAPYRVVGYVDPSTAKAAS